MAYIVLAAGAVMVLIGALAIITGYPIIQVERGWTTVIAGTSLLAGGIVTMALALVLRALMDLRHVIVAPQATAASHASDAGVFPTDRTTKPRFDARVEPTPVEMATPMLDQDTAMIEAAAVAPREPLETRHAEAVLHDQDPHDQKPHDLDPNDHEPHADPAHPLVAGSEAHSQGGSPGEGGSHDHASHDQSSPPLEDWLDRAFADLHEPIAPPARSEAFASTQAEPEQLHADHSPLDHGVDKTESPLEHAPATQLHDDHVAPPTEAHAPHRHGQTQEAYADAMQDAYAETAPFSQAATEPDSTIIGRYEADGTSYTMYADGSIEAQSDAGIYRFASMAELKAFIEG